MEKRALRIVVTLSIVLFQSVLYGQRIRNDQNDFMIKLTLFQEAGGDARYSPSHKALDDFLKLDYQLDTLKSKGFYDFVFISINPEFQNPQKISLQDVPLVIGNCKEFIVAINRSRQIYRLSGFVRNDFADFLSTLKSFHYPDVNSLKRFTKNYSVERLDLGCLYHAFKNYSIEKDKFPCLLTCSEVINIE